MHNNSILVQFLVLFPSVLPPVPFVPGSLEEESMLDFCRNTNESLSKLTLNAENLGGNMIGIKWHLFYTVKARMIKVRHIKAR